MAVAHGDTWPGRAEGVQCGELDNGVGRVEEAEEKEEPEGRGGKQLMGINRWQEPVDMNCYSDQLW